MIDIEKQKKEWPTYNKLFEIIMKEINSIEVRVMALEKEMSEIFINSGN